MHVPIVPVEQEPVKSFQLVFPELIAIFIFPGLFYLLPRVWRWSVL